MENLEWTWGGMIREIAVVPIKLIKMWYRVCFSHAVKEISVFLTQNMQSER